jgi:hypothetical protein
MACGVLAVDVEVPAILILPEEQPGDIGRKSIFEVVAPQLLDCVGL